MLRLHRPNDGLQVTRPDHAALPQFPGPLCLPSTDSTGDDAAAPADTAMLADIKTASAVVPDSNSIINTSPAEQLPTVQARSS